VYNGFDPGEKAFTHRGRGVFSVGMFDLGSVHERMTRSEEGKEEGEEQGDPDGGAE
jgi:hypothetical protein